MTPGQLDLELVQGATFRRTLSYSVDGTPVELGATMMKMQLRRLITDAQVIHELTTKNGGILLLSQKGKFQLHIPADKTALFSFKRAVYDLDISLNDGDTVKLLRGNITLIPEVTR